MVFETGILTSMHDSSSLHSFLEGSYSESVSVSIVKGPKSPGFVYVFTADSVQRAGDVPRSELVAEEVPLSVTVKGVLTSALLEELGSSELQCADESGGARVACMFIDGCVHFGCGIVSTFFVLISVDLMRLRRRIFASCRFTMTRLH